MIQKSQKVVATKAGKFTPRGKQERVIAVGDELTGDLAKAALENGWGELDPSKADKGD